MGGIAVDFICQGDLPGFGPGDTCPYHSSDPPIPAAGDSRDRVFMLNQDIVYLLPVFSHAILQQL
jgi:hypothetical protein